MEECRTPGGAWPSGQSVHSCARFVRIADLDEATRALVAEYTVPRRGLDGELVVDLAELSEFGVLEP